MLEKENTISLEPTCIYGTVSESKNYDMKDILGDKLLDHRLSKIKCFLKSNTSIYGIQFTYRNINDCKETTFINVKSNEKDLIEQEMDLNNEEIKDLRIWLNDDINLIGFEVVTSKGRVQKFGYGNEEQLIKISDFEEEKRVIVGFGCYADEKNGVTAIYGYYISKKQYISVCYGGIFSLRIKLKDPEFKEKIDKKLDSMNEKNKILYKICQLPDNQFFNIIKYSID